MAGEPDKDTPFHRFQRSGGSAHQLQMLEAALRASPELERRVTEVMRSGDLAGIGLLPAESGSDGKYNPNRRELRLRPELLDAEIRRPAIDKVVDVLAHETSHASRREALMTFDREMFLHAHERVQAPGPRDWTGFVGHYIAYGRREEARAELDAVQVMADRIRHENRGAVTEANLAERLVATSACVEEGPVGGFRFKQGITFDPASQTVQATPANLEAVARCHFDSRAGYRGVYAAAAIDKIADRELAMRIDDPLRPAAGHRIDLARLGLDADTLRRAPFGFGPDQPFRFVDSSGGQRALVEVWDGAGDRGQPELRARPEPGLAQPGSPSPAAPRHADHALLRKLQEQVRALDQQAGKGWDEHSERLAASALVMARGSGFSERDELRLVFNQASELHAAGERLHLFRSGTHASGDPMANWAHMGTAEALSQPADLRYRQVAQIEQAQDRQAAQQRALEADMPNRHAPSMQMQL